MAANEKSADILQIKQYWTGASCKTIIWCSILALASTSVFAQSSEKRAAIGDDPKNEIGVNMLGWVHFDYDLLYPRPKGPGFSLMNGVSYKRRVGRAAYRISLDVFRNTFEAGLGTRDRPKYFSATGTGVRTEVRAGYELQFTTGAIRPYAGLDLVASHERLQLSGEGWGDLAWQPEPESYGYDFSTMHYGTSVSIGLAGRLSRRFSCAMESSVLFILHDQESNSNIGNHTSVYFDAVRSFSLNYHFN